MDALTFERERYQALLQLCKASSESGTPVSQGAWQAIHGRRWIRPQLVAEGDALAKEEAAPPPMPADAVIKEEEAPPPMPPDAVIVEANTNAIAANSAAASRAWVRKKLGRSDVEVSCVCPLLFFARLSCLFPLHMFQCGMFTPC